MTNQNKINCPVVHFEMPYEDKDRMVKFYQDAFWSSNKLRFLHIYCKNISNSYKKFINIPPLSKVCFFKGIY